MSTVRLKCAKAEALFYEPDGLLLSASLVPVDEQHRSHLLTFQLSYLGCGDIAVHVGVEGGENDESGPLAEPSFTEAVLHGSTVDEPPGVWLTSTLVSDANVHYRLTVWGQPGEEDDLRGELIAEVSGFAPLLTASTRASVTCARVPHESVLSGPAQLTAW